MKTSKTILYRWPNPSGLAEILNDGGLDIDWPLVKRECGEDCVEWLLKQDNAKCQLSLEFSQSGYKQLIAEFFDEKVAVSYHMMWAK